jgi:DNA-binding Lrp family transcriptional regulator
VPLDATDPAILGLLASDARMSLRRIARELGMSPPAITDGVAGLERLGGSAAIGPRSTGRYLDFPLVVYVGIVSIQGAGQFQVLERLRETPQVEDVHVVTGPKDLLVRPRLRNAVHLRDVLFERIGTVLGVAWTETFVSLGGWRPRRLTSCSSMVSSPTDKRSPEGVLDVTHQAGRKDGDHAA